MSDQFKKYGFKRKIFAELNCTGVQGEALKDSKYGYTREFNIDNNTSITFNIIPNGADWICERETFNWNIYNKISDYKVIYNKEYFDSRKSDFDYAMQKLGYTIKDYKKISRWAYMETKEDALKEIVEQYPYLFE